MRWTKVAVMAGLFALGLAVIPELLPAGPTSGIDAAGLLESGRMFVAVCAIFLGGLLTSLTPCVYPLIPITVGVFGARQADSRAKATVLTTLYVVGMGLVFSALGVVAALSGKAFGSALGNPWVVTGLAVFLLVLASSMFGAFEMALPTGLATRLNTVGGGGYIGALLMGSVSGFLAAPCTGPVLTGVLAYVSRTQDPFVGGGLLFVYALGIGVPFFLIGVFTLRLPKGGEWMDWVKSFFGVALVALAFGYLRDAFPVLGHFFSGVGATLGKPLGIALSVAMVAVGMLLGAIHLSFKARIEEFMLKGVGVVMVAVAVLVRTASGAVAPASHDHTPLAWQITFKAEESNSADPFETALAKAKADCKPVMIDFYADWCAACKELDTNTYSESSVAAESQRFVNIKVDGTNDHDVLTTLYARFGVSGLPTVAFVDPMGEVLPDPRVTGYLPPQKFLAEMKKVRLATCSRSP
jgi:thiol:disulfide interchange protein DsbD